MKIIADIFFLPTADGGRTVPIPFDKFGCPVYFKDIRQLSGHAYDCRMKFKKTDKQVFPGDRVGNVEVIFLSQQEVLSNISVGAEFSLWEGKTIGYGVVSEIQV